MKLDTYSWRLQHHRPIYVWLWVALHVFCLFGPLLFSWKDMGKFLTIYLVSFAVLGWLTWSKPGGILWNQPPGERRE